MGSPDIAELIDFLQKQKPLGALEWSQAMLPAAKSHALDMGAKGKVSHVGSDGSTHRTRMAKYVKIPINLQLCTETIMYGNKSPQEVVMSLMIDKGVANRGHRTVIFTPGFKKMGAFTATHNSGFKQITVMDYTS